MAPKTLYTIPNILTLSRIAALPVFYVLFAVEPQYGAIAAWISLVLYIVCALTDFLDGYLSRKWNEVSAFGTFLDPISDKIFVGFILVLLIEFDRLSGLWIIPVLIIFTREFLISGLREFLGPEGIQMPVTKLAKWKTTSQMISLGFLIIGPFVPFALLGGQILLLAASILTAITGYTYMKAGWPHFRK